MKSLSVRLGFILLTGLIIFSYGKVWGEDWKLYSFDDETIRYYDAEGIKRPSENIVRLWERWEYTDMGVIEMVKKFGKEYENFKFLIALDEINCSGKKLGNLLLNYYSKEGKVIYSNSLEDKWD